MLPLRQRSKLRGSIEGPGNRPARRAWAGGDVGNGERYQDDAMIEAGERLARSLVAAAAGRNEGLGDQMNGRLGLKREAP